MRLGLDILTIAEHPELPAQLQRLVVDERENVRTDALERLDAWSTRMPRRPPHATASTIRRPDVRAAEHPGARRRRGRLGSRRRSRPAERPGVRRCRVAVAFALSRRRRRRGPGAGRAPRSRDSPGPSTRPIARSRRSCSAKSDPGGWIDRTALRALLADRRPRRRQRRAGRAPLAGGRGAAPGDRRPPRQPADGRRGGRRAGPRRRRRARRRRRRPPRRRARSSRAGAARAGGPRDRRTSSAIAVLRRHVDHRDREVGLAVMRALAALGPSDPTLGPTPTTRRHRVGRTRRPRARDPRAAGPRRVRRRAGGDAAVRRRSATSSSSSAERVLAAFSMRHGTDGLRPGRVPARATGLTIPRARTRVARRHADRHRSGGGRVARAPVVGPRAAEHASPATFPLPPLGQREVLLELVAGSRRQMATAVGQGVRALHRVGTSRRRSSRSVTAAALEGSADGRDRRGAHRARDAPRSPTTSTRSRLRWRSRISRGRTRTPAGC